MEHLGPRACWEMLAATPVGRVGVMVDSAPEIYPVNFVVDGEAIVFRTDDGSKLRGFDRSPSVCFEADGIDVDEQTGWSVLVKGRAVEINDTEGLRHVRSLPLRFWGLGAKSHWIRIEPREITGRRIVSVVA